MWRGETEYHNKRKQRNRLRLTRRPTSEADYACTAVTPPTDHACTATSRACGEGWEFVVGLWRKGRGFGVFVLGLEFEEPWTGLGFRV